MQIYVPTWLELPKDIRAHIATVFSLVKTGIAEVRDQTILCDGYSNDDLKGISAVKMAEYTGSPVETPFSQLWTITVSKAKYEVHPPVNLPDFTQSVETVVAVTKDIELNTKDEIVSDRFCDQCDSKGGRHKKICPLY